MPSVVSDHRKPDHAIDPIFWQRWSPRAMSGEPISDHQLHLMLEAARWAPSSYNEQPWRFVYAKRGTPAFDAFFGVLMEANQAWCKTAAVLVAVCTKKTFTKNGQPNSVAWFDAGSAWQNFALQGAQLGLVTHGMAGFDRDKARAALGVPADFDIPAMIAVGKHGPLENLPENYRGGEVPSPRKAIGEWAFEGKFKA